MPAEWHPQARVWVTRPHNHDTWPGCLEQAQQQFDVFVQELSKRVEVQDTESLDIPTNDSWIRDFGPLFVLDETGKTACHDFLFNSWGGKYPPWNHDNKASREIANMLDVSVEAHGVVLEGGAIDVNGIGDILASRSCLLEPNRNRQSSPQSIENLLGHTLGTVHVIWISGMITGDDTDGHIDNVARFINPNTIAVCRAPSSHPDHAELEKNWCCLSKARDQNGCRLNLIELPMPEPMTYDFPPNPAYSVACQQLPASYANFLICNNAVFLPAFSQSADETAAYALEQAMPEHEIIPVESDKLIVGLGGLHCLTMQQPKPIDH